MKRSDKSGQFYLIFAIIIVAVIIGFVTLSNFSSKQDNSEIKELKTVLEIESKNVMEYYSSSGVNKIENFTAEFSNYVGNEFEIIYIVGTKTNPEVYKYVRGNREDVSFTKNVNVLTINFNNLDYSFNLKEGNNFYFIISKEKGGEIYVETNQI
jgi:hypothetical protein